MDFIINNTFLSWKIIDLILIFKNSILLGKIIDLILIFKLIIIPIIKCKNYLPYS